MNLLVEWLALHWIDIAVPFLVLLGALFLGLWLRNFLYRALEGWAKRTRWAGDEIVVQATKRPFLLWFVLLGFYAAIQVSKMPPRWASLGSKVVGSLLVISFFLAASDVAEKLLRFYLGKARLPTAPIALFVNGLRVAVFIVALLILLEVWGLSTAPFILLLATLALFSALAFRDIFPSIFAGFQLSSSGQIKNGDYVKLGTGEEGYVTRMDWRNVQLKALDDSSIVIPNSKLVETTVINYGRPLKKAKEVFRFYTRLNQKELTGLRARTLRELVQLLKEVPDSVIYYHTHSFLEEHHYLTPQPPNDFAHWTGDVLGEVVLGEKLASIDTFEFPTLAALRARIVNTIEEHLANAQDSRNAPEGQEFHFMKSTSVVFPTPYVAHDLREFVEVLRKISINSLYFHMFEARLRLQRGANDFSIWLKDSLGDEELANQFAKLDPYNYTLEGLRSSVIQLIEKRIK